MTAAAVEAAHVCRCGHYRVTHTPRASFPEEDACRDCDCEAFEAARVNALTPPPSGAASRVVVYDEPKPPKVEAPKQKDALAFRRLVRRLRRAQVRYFVERGSRTLSDAIALERAVDAALAAFVDDPVELDPQGSLFTPTPAMTEYFLANRTAARQEAERHAKREHKASLEAGFTKSEAAERAERANRAFFEALAKAARARR